MLNELITHHHVLKMSGSFFQRNNVYSRQRGLNCRITLNQIRHFRMIIMGIYWKNNKNLFN
jgi:hypothetical protein